MKKVYGSGREGGLAIEMEVVQPENALYSTPKKSNATSSSCNEVYPECEDEYRPQAGMIFELLQDGVDYYKAYAHYVGFSVRLSSETKKDGIIGWKYVVCSKEGWHKDKEPELLELELPIDVNSVSEKMGDSKKKIKRRRSLTREGCKATCAFKRTLEGKYEIFKVHEGHTHALATPSKKSMLRSARQVPPLLKDMLLACHRVNVGTSQTFNVVTQTNGGARNVGCTRRDLQNFHRDLKALIKNSDAHMFIDKFKRMKEKNPSFYFDYELDDNRLKHVFWADGIARKNYALFGDAISFDTTFSTNKYSLIFAPFTGINHHRQSVNFGAAFLANETIGSFVWLFEKFLDAMGGHKPKCIVTDQDPAMKVAIKKVFDTSKHRFCVWHIMKKVSEKVGGVLNSNPIFHSTLGSCVWASETPEEFESNWLSMISEFGLEKHDWFTLMFDLREMWIPAYFRDVFLAGLFRTTSRSESENSMFNHFVNKQLSLVEFWMRFDCAIEIQRDNEREFDNANSSSMPQLKTDMDLEKHGRGIYTHKNFYIFQEELWSSCIDCVVAKIHEDDGCTVFTIRDINKESRKSTRNVVYNASTHEAKCSCKMYILEGIPCRHILVVLRGDMLNEIPTSLISNRWTKTATRQSIFDDGGILLEGCKEDNDTAQLVSSVWGSFYELMHIADKNKEDLKFVLEACKNTKKYLTNSGETVPSKEQELESFAGSSVPAHVGIHPPKPSSTKGSWKGRLRGGKEVAVEIQEKRARLCKYCEKYDYHDSRNCPEKLATEQE